MISNRTVGIAIRRTLLCGAVAATSFATSLAAAQNAPDAKPTAQEVLETVVVTGSRIQRPELEAATPTLALSSEALTNQGFENIADLATSLPQFTPSFGSSRTQSTFSGAASSGLNNANLRNLGPVRTVVLINGRRVPGGTSVSTKVDFNTIPTANIERIEVITGGASAIYGADAVAGVINLITKKSFSGIEVGASYGETRYHDNENPSGYIMLGGNFGERGHGLITVQYDKQEDVSCKDRFLCAEDFLWTNPTGAYVRGGAVYSAVGLQGSVIFPTSGRVPIRNGQLTDANGNLFSFVTATDGYNRNADRDLAIPTQRIMFAAEGEYTITDAVTAFTELNYGKSETDSVFEAHPLQSFQPGNLFGTLTTNIPINNPFVPAAARAKFLAESPTAVDMPWAQRIKLLGNRGANNQRDSIRAVAGVKGEFSVPGMPGPWNWEASYVFGRTKLDGLTEGLVGTDRMYYGLRVEADPANPGKYRCSDAGARALGCVPVNPFQPYTQAMSDWLTVTAGQRGESRLQDVMGFISGPIFSLPAGDVQAVLGAERRTFSGYLDYDESINRGLIYGNAIGDVSDAMIKAKEIFAELLVPVLEDKPFARKLSLEGAYRHTNSNIDDYNTWKVGATWEPLEGVRFRAMRALSVRAPVPDELSGIGQTFGQINNPCTAANRNANATRAANCTADGVPANYNPPQSILQSVAGLTGGNPNLKPEEGNSFTVGVVWTPTFLRNFSVSVDRFSIDVKDIITSLARQDAVNLCYDTSARLYCDAITRGASPLVPGANYVLLAANEQQQNIAREKIGGTDIDVRYGFDLADMIHSKSSSLGTLNASLLMTVYNKADFVPQQGQAAIKLLGAAGGSTADLNQGFIKKQGTFNLNYAIGRLNANWAMRYVGATDMSPTDKRWPRIHAHSYHNVRVGYGIMKDSEVYVGVTNVFDKDPPFFGFGTSGTQALDTIPGYYDIFGRSWFAGVRFKF